jgi:hypothetical protein
VADPQPVREMKVLNQVQFWRRLHLKVKLAEFSMWIVDYRPQIDLESVQLLQFRLAVDLDSKACDLVQTSQRTLNNTSSLFGAINTIEQKISSETIYNMNITNLSIR